MDLFSSLSAAVVVKAHIRNATAKTALNIVKDNPDVRADLQKVHGVLYADGFDTWLRDATKLIGISPGVCQRLMDIALRDGKISKTFLATDFTCLSYQEQHYFLKQMDESMVDSYHKPSINKAAAEMIKTFFSKRKSTDQHGIPRLRQLVAEKAYSMAGGTAGVLQDFMPVVPMSMTESCYRDGSMRDEYFSAASIERLAKHVIDMKSFMKILSEEVPQEQRSARRLLRFWQEARTKPEMIAQRDAVIERLKKLLTRVQYTQKSLQAECPEAAFMPRTIFFDDKLHSSAFDNDLLECETLEGCLETTAIVKELQIRRRAAELDNFVKGKLNTNELHLPVVRRFREKLRSGFFDLDLVGHDAAISWSEEAFVQKEIGGIFQDTRTYAIVDLGNTAEPASEQFEAEVERRVAIKMEAKRVAMESDFERRVCQRTEELHQRVEESRANAEKLETESRAYAEKREAESRAYAEKREAEMEKLRKMQEVLDTERALAQKKEERCLLLEAEATNLKKRVGLLEGRGISDCSLNALGELGQTLISAQSKINSELLRRAL